MSKLTKVSLLSVSGVMFSALLLLHLGCFGGDDSPPAATVKLLVTGSGSRTATKNLSRFDGTPTGSPTYLAINMYAFYISPNTDCTGAIEVANNGSTPVEHDVYASPTLFSANPDDGTYNCVIIKMGDLLKYKVDATAVAAHTSCTAVGTDTIITRDVLRTGTTWKDHTGANVIGTGTLAAPSEDIVYIMASTVPADVIGGPLGANSEHVVTLQSPLIVSGTGGTGVFYADWNDGIEEGHGGQPYDCSIEGNITNTSGFGFR